MRFRPGEVIKAGVEVAVAIGRSATDSGRAPQSFVSGCNRFGLPQGRRACDLSAETPAGRREISGAKGLNSRPGGRLVGQSGRGGTGRNLLLRRANVNLQTDSRGVYRPMSRVAGPAAGIRSPLLPPPLGLLLRSLFSRVTAQVPPARRSADVEDDAHARAPVLFAAIQFLCGC